MPTKKVYPKTAKLTKKISKKKGVFILFLLIIFLIAIDYPFLDKLLREWLIDYEIGIAERIIDGDTIVVNGSNVRLLGINSPEKGEIYYEEAANFLEERIFGKLVKLEKGKEDEDLYHRKLRYIFYEGDNINLKLVENGLANFYFPSGRDQYYKDFKKHGSNA